MLLCLLLALLLPLAPPSLVPADTTDDGIEVGFRIIPNAFYSSTKGFGVGGGVALKNVFAPGTELFVTAQAMQRFGRYRAAFFTSDPFEAPLYTGVAGQYVTDQVYRFYGLGPQSSADDNVFVDLERVEAELRVGWYPLGTGPLLLQPVVRLLHTNVHSFRDRDPDAFLRLDAASQRTLFESVNTPTTGVTYGLEVAVDTRDKPRYSSRGALFLLTGRRYDGLGDDAFRYYAGTASAYGFVPLPAERHVLFGRAILALTRPIGDDVLPFYALPVLDDDLLDAYTSTRFHGHDLLVFTAGYHFPLLTLLDWFAFDANVAVSAANAYDDVFEQFAPGIAFGTDFSDEGTRTRLRPALSLGLQFVNLERERVVISGQVGLSPEGFRLGTVRLVYEIRDLYPVVR
ncbi:MAG: hypothetical protein ABJF88_13185 [Rhodothermales bacterium]